MSEDEKVVASGLNDCRVRLWSGKDGNAVGESICGHEWRISSISVSEDGKVVAGGCGKSGTYGTIGIDCHHPANRRMAGEIYIV